MSETKKFKGVYKIVSGERTIELDEVPVVVIDLNKRKLVEEKKGDL